MPVVALTRDSTNTVSESNGRRKEIRENSYFISDRALWFFRLVSLLLCAARLTWRIIVSGDKHFYYLTNWNWILNFLFFAAAVIHKRPSSSPLINSLFAALQPISWIVTLVFWALLFDGGKDAVDISNETISHSLNLLLVVIDLFLNRIILHLPHIVCSIIFSLLYIGTVLVCRLVYNADWPYPFLATVNGGLSSGINIGYTTAFVIGFWIVCMLFFGFTVLLIWIRERLGQPTLKNHTALQMEQV